MQEKISAVENRTESLGKNEEELRAVIEQMKQSLDVLQTKVRKNWSIKVASGSQIFLGCQVGASVNCLPCQQRTHVHKRSHVAKGKMHVVSVQGKEIVFVYIPISSLLHRMEQLNAKQ